MDGSRNIETLIGHFYDCGEIGEVFEVSQGCASVPSLHGQGGLFRLRTNYLSRPVIRDCVDSQKSATLHFKPYRINSLQWFFGKLHLGQGY